METIVKDPLGRITGIAIPASNIKLYIEKEFDQIRLYGKMTTNEGALGSLEEPEVLCCLTDSAGRILYESLGTHSGCFRKNRETAFSIEIMDVSRKCNWDEITGIELSVIYL